MRDQRRIAPVIQALVQAWHQHPDMRLGQLLFAVAGQNSIFAMEEDEWLRRLESLTREGKFPSVSETTPPPAV